MSVELLLQPEYYLYFTYSDYYSSCSFFEKELLILMRITYLSILYILKPILMLGFFYYQAMFIALIIYAIRVYRDKNLYKDSSISWLFLTLKRISHNFVSYSFFYYYISNKILLFFDWLRFLIFQKCRYFSSYMYDILKEKLRSFSFWKPTFKKTSYFGIFSSMRSKWFKNKKKK